jgi:hypothetical protein
LLFFFPGSNIFLDFNWGVKGLFFFFPGSNKYFPRFQTGSQRFVFFPGFNSFLDFKRGVKRLYFFFLVLILF